MRCVSGYLEFLKESLKFSVLHVKLFLCLQALGCRLYALLCEKHALWQFLWICKARVSSVLAPDSVAIEERCFQNFGRSKALLSERVRIAVLVKDLWLAHERDCALARPVGRVELKLQVDVSVFKCEREFVVGRGRQLRSETASNGLPDGKVSQLVRQQFDLDGVVAALRDKRSWQLRKLGDLSHEHVPLLFERLQHFFHGSPLLTSFVGMKVRLRDFVNRKAHAAISDAAEKLDGDAVFFVHMICAAKGRFPNIGFSAINSATHQHVCHFLQMPGERED